MDQAEFFEILRAGKTIQYTNTEHRPSWMSDSQWKQAVDWIKGIAVPTDPTLTWILQCQDILHYGYPWVYSHVPNYCVWDNYAGWEKLITGYSYLQLDEGI